MAWIELAIIPTHQYRLTQRRLQQTQAFALLGSTPRAPDAHRIPVKAFYDRRVEFHAFVQQAGPRLPESRRNRFLTGELATKRFWRQFEHLLKMWDAVRLPEAQRGQHPFSTGHRGDPPIPPSCSATPGT